MSEFSGIGRLLIIAGIILVTMGVVILLYGKLPFLGKLPGDILIKKKNFTFYFPLTTGIILSILITLVFYLISRHR